MHPADLEAARFADASADSMQPHWLASRSLQLVRLLILAAFGIGLLGLSLPGGATPAVAVTAAPSALSPAALQGEMPVRHASRSRAAVAAVKPLAHKPVTRKKHVAHGPKWVRPSGAGIVSPYAMRWGRMHKGIDFGASYGAAIRAIGDGVVVGSGYLGDEGGYGKITIIRHAGGIYSAYAHQSRTAVHTGDHVKAGEVIGYVGSSGHSTGPHLHFEIRLSEHGDQVNPLRWLRAHHVYI